MNADARASRLTELLQLRSTQLLDLDDAGHALVVNDETGSMQLYEYQPDGTRMALTGLSEPVTGRYLPGQRTVVVSVDDSGTERTQLWLLDPAEAAAGKSADGLPTLRPLVTDPAYIHTLLEVFDDRVIYATNRRNGVDFDIVSRTVSSGAEQVLIDSGGWFGDAHISPDGRFVAAGRLTAVAASSQVLLIDTLTGETSEITDAGEAGEWSGLHWLADSSALIGSSDSGGERVSVRRFDVATRTWSVLLADPAADVWLWPSPTGPGAAWVRSVDGADELFLVDLFFVDTLPGASGDEGRSAAIPLPHEGVVTFRTPIVFSPDGSRLGFTLTSPVQPAEAYEWSAAGGVRRLSQSNPDGALAGLRPLTSHLVTASGGEQIPVLVLSPERPDGSAVLIIHGGPEGATVRSFNAVAAGLAAAGHTVVLPNVRGSSGYGRRWLSLDDVELRLDSVADLAAIHAWLPSIGVAPDRVALYGGSYGGYMVLAGLAFYPELWAAGVDIVGMSSLVTFLRNTSAYRRQYREREYGSLAEHLDVLEAASPLNRIEQVRAPLFVIHGANDPRVPLSEAEQVAAAVRANGAPCELLVYPDEGHGLAKRANRLDAYPRAAAFLAEHLGSGKPSAPDETMEP